MDISAAAVTHVGKMRDQNEDAVHAGAAVFAVADGLGGHAAGEVASSLAIDAVAALDAEGLGDSVGQTRSALADAVQRANRAVYDDARETPEHRGMGTTLTVGAVHDRALVVAHVGDSRAYLVRDGSVQQLTTDHASGPFTLTRVVGVQPEVKVDTYDPVPLHHEDVIVLCSDGLTAVVEDEELPGLVTGRAAREAADTLVDLTLDRGAPDNVAVIVLTVSDPPA